MDELIADFLTETHEGLAALDVALVRLESTPGDAATLSEIFRLVHTIKGTCGFLGLARLERVAHAAESLLGQIRDGALAATPDAVTLVLSAIDRIRALITAIEAAGAEPAGEDGALIGALEAATRGEWSPPPPGAAPGATDAAAAGDGAAAPAAVPEAAGPAAPQTIRVSVEVLEELLVQAGELVLTRNQLLQLARDRDDAALSAALQRLSHVTSELQEGVMKTRMQPIGHAWNTLPRLVRDLSRELGKRIALELRGEGTELDRQVLELIKDPLTHMVRNSADHGLEDPAARRAAGKAETGRILLEACHEGGHILIRLSDDGRGLDLTRIRAKALSQGLAGEAELAAMGEREVQRFIFHPGFSTAASVTAVSGRGVGMDVVKTNVERIGGTIEVESTPGRGTRFAIRIPLTLAIISALIVAAGGHRFALPQAGVVELVRLGEAGQGARIERIGDAPVLRLRDHLLPLVSLARLLRLEQAPGPAGAAAGPARPEGDGVIAVTQVGAQRFGLILDRVFDIEEIVVKPVAPILRHVTVFAGSTILGDGSVIMILDANGVARAGGLGDGRAQAEGAAEPDLAAGLRASDGTALLLVAAGGGAPKAVPLGLVARLEDIDAGSIEQTGGGPVLQDRGVLMPLVPVDPDWRRGAPGTRQAVLVFRDGERSLGLMVDAILDVVEQPLRIEGGEGRPGYLGTAIVAGAATEVLDAVWWLRRGTADWFGATAAASARVLVVEDSGFFRHIVVPALSAAGYAVTAAESAEQALRLREAGIGFDAIISDIGLPGVDGFGFARAVRQSGAWSGLPLIALTAQTDPAAVRRGQEAGFTDYVAKFDREALLTSLRQCLEARGLEAGAAAMRGEG
ncbi:chemotaxis protein CheW [Roseomonas sp. OT10]|uniref:hybrid sensor histidine kinase/response regulator n=1 Tax=Roseomonas cutis TaxID=2897332 RepID=UPI001E5F9CB0|nr:chemotaxis protein CheW [Roseomonas sp. OT10]UFN51139.1 chemotaxis protein CheW [Roseomonas sp. OT10]